MAAAADRSSALATTARIAGLCAGVLCAGGCAWTALLSAFFSMEAHAGLSGRDAILLGLAALTGAGVAGVSWPSLRWRFRAVGVALGLALFGVLIFSPASTVFHAWRWRAYCDEGAQLARAELAGGAPGARRALTQDEQNARRTAALSCTAAAGFDRYGVGEPERAARLYLRGCQLGSLLACRELAERGAPEERAEACPDLLAYCARSDSSGCARVSAQCLD